MSNSMRVIECTLGQHAAAILEIFNEAIVTSTALYDYQPRTLDSMGTWWKVKSDGGFPVLGVQDGDGQLLGFGSYGTFRAFPAYKYSVEHSVYVHKDHRGQGIGLLLLRSLIEAAQRQQLHVMVAGIDVANTASIALHENLGFVHAGTIKQAGFKFGRWLDLAFYQLILSTPDHPVDG